MFTHCIFNESNNKLTYYTGKDCLDEFFNDLTDHVNRISKIKAKHNSHSDPKVHKSNSENTICLICSNQILTNNPHAYRHYCKKTGDLYGFRHGECHEPKLEITVLFHNGAKFDFRLIIEYLANKCCHSNINCILHRMETVLTFSIINFNATGINLRFIDSYKHLTYPLDSLMNYLFNKDTKIQSIKIKFSSLFQHFNDSAVKLLRKGYYMDHMDEDWESKLKRKELRDIKYLHSSLNNTKCSVDDYNYTTEIYNYFGCEEISDYNDLYVKTDVLLIADVFTTYRKKNASKLWFRSSLLHIYI